MRLSGGGTARIARLIPRDIAATSHDVVDPEGTVLRATTSIASRTPPPTRGGVLLRRRRLRADSGSSSNCGDDGDAP